MMPHLVSGRITRSENASHALLVCKDASLTGSKQCSNFACESRPLEEPIDNFYQNSRNNRACECP